jgi:hypothetical protein
VIALETAVRVIVDLLVRHEYGVVEAITRGKRLDAGELALAVDEYGRTLVPPSDDWWSTVRVTPLQKPSSTYHVAAPLWTAEEGQSDLTLELQLEESIPGVFDTEVLDIHVL